LGFGSESHNLVVALVTSKVVAFHTSKAILSMYGLIGLVWDNAIATITSKAERTDVNVSCKFRLAGEDHVAALALEVVLLKVLVKNVTVRSVKIAARLQAVLVF
jgi:hypothetical protein